jgi:hypothetical protein
MLKLEPRFAYRAELREPVALVASDARYAWLDSVMAAAEGRALPNAVAYRVSEVVGE